MGRFDNYNLQCYKQSMDKMDNKFMGLVGIFFLVFGLFAVNVFFGTNIRQIKARTVVPSAQKTTLFSSVRELTANNTEKGTISIFLRADDGSGIAETPVTVSTTFGTITPPEVVTDKSGIANFFLTCSGVGIAQISAQSKGTAVGNTVSVACK